MQVVNGVLPCLSGVGVIFPTVSLLSGCPVGYFETLEESTGSTIECDVSDSLKHGIRMEVLSVNVMLDVRLLVELIAVEILDSYSYIINININWIDKVTYFPGLLDVESVGDEGEVWMDESESFRHVLLEAVSGGEH